MHLQPGDIFATKGNGPAGWAVRNLLSPNTNRFHFGILWRKGANGDFIIFESLSKGLTVGLLNFYDTTKLKFYRVNCPVGLRYNAPEGLLAWGRAKYDYWLVLKLALGAVLAFARVLIKERRVRRLRAEDLPYGVNSSLICTEAVDVAYDSVGVNVIPEGVVPIPNAFRQAEIEGRMSELEVSSNGASAFPSS